MADWREFEGLIATVEKALNNTPGVTVSHNIKLPTIYGVKRQVDVLIAFDSEHVKKTIVIECKKRKAKTSINTVEAFYGTMKAVKADEGIIVSSSGFQSGAIKIASHYNIQLYTFSQVSELQQYLQSFQIYPTELKQTILDIYVEFTSSTEINHLLTIDSPLYAEDLIKAITIRDMVGIFLDARKQELSKLMFGSIFDPTKAQRLTGTNEIKLEFPTPLIFRVEDKETEVIGFRAVAQATLITGPTHVERTSIYGNIKNTEPKTLVCELAMNPENQEWLQKNWSPEMQSIFKPIIT